MPKNIIICSDGTGNSDIKGRGTNVFKLFEATDLNGHRTNPTLTPQVAIYDDGVGTENFRQLKIFTGATGYGLSRNVKQLYKELVRIYDPDQTQGIDDLRSRAVSGRRQDIRLDVDRQSCI